MARPSVVERPQFTQSAVYDGTPQCGGDTPSSPSPWYTMARPSVVERPQFTQSVVYNGAPRCGGDPARRGVNGGRRLPSVTVYSQTVALMSYAYPAVVDDCPVMK